MWAKSDLPIRNSVCEKVWFTINEPSKMLFFNLWLFHFSKFKMTIVKNLMEKPSFFIMDFEGSYEVLLRHKCFWSTHFWQWNDGLFKISRNLHENVFCFFTFSKWKKHTTSLLVIHLKCTVLHYANLNSNPISKPYLNYRHVFLSFFSISYLFLF